MVGDFDGPVVVPVFALLSPVREQHPFGWPVRRCVHAAHVSRAGPSRELSGDPRVLERDAWSADRNAAAPVASRDVANPMSVQWFGDMFVSVTKENEWWGSRLRVDTAPARAGTVVSGCGTQHGWRHEVFQGAGTTVRSLMPWLDGARPDGRRFVLRWGFQSLA